MNIVKSREDLVAFINLLVEDLKGNPDKWENKDLLSYLEAMGGWIEDMEGYYANNGIPLPNEVIWRIFADILVAAKMYE